ncbi:hypothetical protein H110_02715 [Trichophyton rubrum MR1448]|nr:hypothetical protein H110_02715 [Trichophyton rubrum MR1448]
MSPESDQTEKLDSDGVGDGVRRLPGLSRSASKRDEDCSDDGRDVCIDCRGMEAEEVEGLSDGGIVAV